MIFSERTAWLQKKLLIIFSLVAAILIGVVMAESFMPSAVRNTILKEDTLRITPEEYTIDHSRKHPPKMDTDYPYDDCAPIELTFTLPKNDEEHTYVMLSHVQSWVRIWVAGERIYSYFPEKGSKAAETPVSIFHLAALPHDMDGKELHIEIIPSLKETANRYPVVYLGDKGSLVLDALLFSLPKACLTVLLFILAMIILVMTFTPLLRERPEVRRQARSFAFLLIDMCGWIFMEIRIRQFIFDNYTLSLSITTICFFLIPVFFACFIACFNLFASGRPFRYLMLAAWGQFFAFAAGFLMGIRPYRMQPMMWTVSALLLIYVTYKIVCALRSHSLPKELGRVCRSMCWLPIGFFAELIQYFFINMSQSGVFILLFLIGFSVQYSYMLIRDVVEESRESIREKDELRLELEHERVRGMMVQMNPHFLYNALTAIQAIIKINPDYAYNLIYDFSVHLRGTIKALSVEKISFREELQNVQAYLNIEKMRFEKRLRVEYDIQYDDFDVIPLCVQPLAENASRHGIFPRGPEGGTLTICSFAEPDAYIIQVVDDGVGFDAEMYFAEESYGKHIGISNLSFRLKKVMNAEILFDSVPGEGTIATIRIPR
ncbi:MAG: histidine kinase [Bacillota bacterium]|nr:histidine kinase [Bacillota bacterium]